MKIIKNMETAFIIVAVLWGVHLINPFLPVDLRTYGLQPRRIDHLQGIIFMPFLHGNLYHLLANSSTLFILLSVAMTLGRKLTFKALLIITFVGGGLVWLFGSSRTLHIGASGTIFGLIGFLMFLGFFRREWKPLFFSIIVFFLYGGALFSLLIYVPGISWTGHFFGFLSGVLAAWWLRKGKIS